MNIFDWFNSLPKSKRNIYFVLLGVIGATIPCYCVGIIALATASPTENLTPTPFSLVSTATPAIPALPTLTPTIATGASPDNRTPTSTLEPTPTQSFPNSTPSPSNTPSPTTVPGTATPTPTGTVQPTNTSTPTPTVNTTATVAAAATATARAQAISTAEANATATAAANATATAQASGNPPIANDNTATTNEYVPVSINVTANDSDPDGNLDLASLTIIGGPNNGSAFSDGAGNIVYTPNPGFSGTDSLEYRICDTTGNCDTATVTITVLPVEPPPQPTDEPTDQPTTEPTTEP